MSFRLFVYYCAVAGAWCGFLGWAIGIPVRPDGSLNTFTKILGDAIAAMVLGLFIAFGLSLLDAVFNFSLSQMGKVIVRVLAGTVFGAFAGLFGGAVGSGIHSGVVAMIGEGFFANLMRIPGWIIAGALVGFSVGIFEVIRSLLTGKDFAFGLRKLRNCFLGGTIGGILGGIVQVSAILIAAKLAGDKRVWSPTAIGFVAIGACIGLLIGLAQVILKEAWIKVEAGFRPGREMLLQKEKTSIGRAEGSDIALFGDMGIEKTHAHIVKDAGRYYLEDSQTPGGSFVNDQKVNGRAPLKTGDLIRVGKSILRFNERAKRKD